MPKAGDTDTPNHARSKAKLVTDAILVTLRGRAIGERLTLDPSEEKVVIGRDDEAHLSIADDSASRFHCELTFKETGWFIKDLSSTNGTYVGGHLIDSALLRDGDIIKVGATIFKFLSSQNIEAAYHEEIYALTITDGLTQLYNRRYLEDFMEREMSRCRRHGRPMTIMLFDIDGFKAVNDRFGHLSGDHVLRSIGDKLGRRIRREEALARLGGDEFVVVLPETNLEDALKFAEIIRKSIELMPIIFDGWKIPITVSIGIGQYQSEMNSVADLIADADAALYRAKAKGANQISD